MAFKNLFSIFMVVLSICSSAAFCMEKDDLIIEEKRSLLKNLPKKEIIDEKAQVIINKKTKCCENIDIDHWGFIVWLKYGRSYFQGCCGDSGDEIGICCLATVCCPLATAGWLIVAPISCLECGCFCPERKDETSTRMNKIDLDNCGFGVWLVGGVAYLGCNDLECFENCCCNNDCCNNDCCNNCIGNKKHGCDRYCCRTLCCPFATVGWLPLLPPSCVVTGCTLLSYGCAAFLNWCNHPPPSPYNGASLSYSNTNSTVRSNSSYKGGRHTDDPSAQYRFNSLGARENRN